MHEFIEPPEGWGDFCWHWNEDENDRCGWTMVDHDEDDDYMSLTDWDYAQSYLSGSGEHESDSYIAYLNG